LDLEEGFEDEAKEGEKRKERKGILDGMPERFLFILSNS